jgi:hypothetical protein
MKKLFVIMIAMLTMVAFGSSVMAQAPAKPAAPATPEKMAPAPAPTPAPAAEKPAPAKKKAAKEMKSTGTVAAYEAGKMITVKSKDKETTYDVTGDTKIKGEVKGGAKVTVMYKKDGDKMIATSITVSAAKKAKK